MLRSETCHLLERKLHSLLVVLQGAIVNQESDANNEANEVRKLDEYKPLTC